MKLNGNKALITGATSGIGRALAIRFMQAGSQVIGVGRTPEKLRELQRQFPALIPYACDLTRREELENLVVFIEQQHPDLNVLINNAAIQYNYSFSDGPADMVFKIEHEIQSNLVVPVKLCALLIPLLQQQPGAAIVNVSTGLALVPKKSAPVYCGSKAGLHIFTQALRYQLEDTGIRVFEIIPPLVDTPMTAGRGKGKISPEQLVDEFVRSFANDHYEINIGKVKLLRAINRLSPALAGRIMKNG
jgi:uncharacterized oxidoreductase